jgi:hypothetical protein
MSFWTVVLFSIVVTGSTIVAQRTLFVPREGDTRADRITESVLLWVVLALVWFLAFRVGARLL